MQVRYSKQTQYQKDRLQSYVPHHSSVPSVRERYALVDNKLTSYQQAQNPTRLDESNSSL